MIRTKLGELIAVTRGASLPGENYATSGSLIRLTLGNFDMAGGWKENTSKDNIYYSGDVRPEFILKKGDLITPLTEQTPGLLGTVARIPESDRYIQSQDVGLIKCKPEKLDPSFAYYLISSKLVRDQLGAAAQQTKIRHTSPEKIKDCVVFVPDIEDQRKIGAFLDNYTNKIENNKKQIAVLESLAKTLYDYWFLQFDFPDENGKPYKSSGGKMAWNDMLGREIPEGWEVRPISDAITHMNTGLNPRDNFKLGNGKIRYLTVKNIGVGGTVDFSGCDVIDERARALVHKRSQVAKGDILFASIAPLGRCFIVEEDPADWDINESVFSIRPNYQLISTNFLYMYFMSPYFIKKAELSSTGSIFAGIRMSTFQQMQMLIPPKCVLDNFDKIIDPIYKDKYGLWKQNQTLKDEMNFLLPVLLNGQVKLE